MITRNEIRRITYRRTFEKGNNLFLKGHVGEIEEIYDIDDENKVTLEAIVKGSGRNSYSASCYIDLLEDAIIEYECECPASYEYNSMCKHCTALLLRYIENNATNAIQNQQYAQVTIQKIFESQGIQKGFSNTTKGNLVKKRETDYGIHRLLVKQGEERTNRFNQLELKGKVHLLPYIYRIGTDLGFELKIGITQMYIIKDMGELIRNIDSQSYKKYGAKLEFIHYLEAFDQESIELIKIIRELIQRDGRFSYGYFEQVDYKRTFKLTGSNVDRFFNIYQEYYMKTSDGKDDIVYKIVEEKPNLSLEIQGYEDGISLQTAPYGMTVGTEYQYIYYNDSVDEVIFKTTIKDSKASFEFQKYMAEQRGRSIFIEESDLSVFCRDLLPSLKKFYCVKIKDFSQEKYMPETAEYKIYLDAPKANIIACRLKADYGNEEYDVFGEKEFAQRRDVNSELEMAARVGAYFPNIDKVKYIRYFSGDLDEVYEFLQEGMPVLRELGNIYVSEKMKKLQIVKPPAIKIGISLKSNLLDLQVDATDMSREELVDILAHYNRRKKYYQLKDGSFIDMQDSQMKSAIALVDGLHLSEKQLQKGDITIPGYRALYLDALAKEDNMLHYEKNKEFKHLVKNMHSIEDSDYELPQSLKGTLRNYQEDGFRWLKTLKENGFGGILADDMGLGKTLQVIAFLASEMENAKEEEYRKTLIITPASLVFNWANEIEKFAPQLKVTVVVGDANTRKEIILASGSNDIILTSYDLLKRDIEVYQSIRFWCQIIDEAQYIKNHSTMVAKAVKAIQAGNRFALTGTPMENRLSELWSIFDYLMPDFLYSYNKFKEDLESPIVESKSENAMLQLRRMITPFILRRLKKDVLKDLPDKLEEVIYANLEGEQKKLYQAALQHLKESIGKKSEQEFKESKLAVLAELTKLRQICCNPVLTYENYHAEAAKVDVCIELIQHAIEAGHKVLVFSQFTSMLDLLTVEANKENITYYKITGSTNKQQRIEMVEAFNQNDVNVFFISLKAGGTGLNLTGADIVIHFDPWWNLAAQNQATDRAHRIGQKNVVTVYKIIAKSTIEEKILKLQEQKQELADQILGGENMDNPRFSRDDLMELLS